MSEALPSGWRLVRLLDVVSLPSSQVDPTQMPFRDQVLLAPDHIESGMGRILKRETAAEQAAVSGKYQVKPGDVAYSKIRPALRKASLIGFHGTCSADMYPLRPSGDIDGRFLLAVILSGDFSVFADSVSGRSGIPKVNRVELGEYIFALPSLSGQRRIADLLDAVDEAISTSVGYIEKLSLVRDGLVSRLLSGVQGGSRMPLVGFAEVTSGVTLGGSLVGSGGKFPCITVANVQDGHLDLDDVKEILLPASVVARYILRSGDFLMTEGGDFDKLGRGTVWQGEIENCLYQNHIFRIRCDQNRLLPEFLSIYSASWYGKNYFRLASKQSTNLASINSTQVKAFPVPMISLEGQRRIISIVQAHDERIAAEKVRLEKLRKLKAGLMDDLLTGRVRVDQLDELPV